jgi:hypothetical protein
MLYQHLEGGEPCPVVGVPRTGNWVFQTREPETLEEKYICDGCVTLKCNTYTLLPLPVKSYLLAYTQQISPALIPLSIVNPE